MKITIRSKFFMFLCGWGTFPDCVMANHGLWWQWFKRARKDNP